MLITSEFTSKQETHFLKATESMFRGNHQRKEGCCKTH